nr:MAG TPA: hypothetical protein [Caudoviricetes sp.]
MCRDDRGWHRLSPALTESGKVSRMFAGLKIRSVRR